MNNINDQKQKPRSLVESQVRQAGISATEPKGQYFQISNQYIPRSLAFLLLVKENNLDSKYESSK